MTRPEFGRVWVHLRAMYPNARLHRWTAAKYWDYLGHLDFAVLCDAVRQHVMSCNWFPTVAELLARLPRAYERPVVLPLAERIGPAEIGEVVRQFLDRPPGQKK
jgi:hypothetical protein